MKDKEDLEVKRKIFNLIKKNPGLHASKIAEILKISWELANYHILYLERNELINITKKDGYNRCFASGEIGEKDREILSLLRQKNPLKIVLFLLMKPYSRFSEILVEVKVAPSTLSYHLKKLLDRQIIYSEVIKNEKRFFVKDRKYVIQILINYKPHSLIEDYEDMWKDFLWTKDLF
jgi:predicted transcriptional regulator